MTKHNQLKVIAELKKQIMKESTMPPVKEVTFNLWAVIAGIIMLGGFVAGVLASDQREVRTKQQEVIQRVVKLETAFLYVVSSMERLEKGQQEMIKAQEKALEALRKHVENNK